MTGSLEADRLFTWGSQLPEGRAVFLFDGATGSLYYDRDGSYAAAPDQLAALSGTTQLAASDIQVVLA